MLRDFIRECIPITGIEVLNKKVLRIVRTSEIKHNPRGGKRGEVKGLSKKSIRKIAVMVALSDVKLVSMMTLTYPREFPLNGRTTKAHLNRFLTWFRRDYKSHSYVWFLEFQRRGAPHYHILTSVPDKEINREKMACQWGRAILKAVGDDWQSTREEYKKIIKVHRHKKAWERIRKEDNGVRYLLAYAAKQKQKAVPDGFQNVGRFWGTSRDVPPGEIDVKYWPIDEPTLLHYLKMSGMLWGEVDVLPRYIFLPDGQKRGSKTDHGGVDKGLTKT